MTTFLATTPVEHATSDTEESSWRAVQDRDARYDGDFVYAVSSTGIYCRPSCPSRRPRRDRVRFFAGPEDAQRAGFRACLRCLPDGRAAESDSSELVRLACQHIRESQGRLPTLTELGNAVGVSPSHLQRTFKRTVGITPRQYGAAWRLDRFKSLVREDGDVASAIYGAGFGSSSRLYENAERRLGMSPGRYRKGAPGAAIQHTVVDSPLGKLLVAATERGVCSVKLGDSPDALESELLAEFPAAEHRTGDGPIQGWVEAIVEYLKGRQPSLDLPLDVRATAFQSRVWRLLQSIPYGETRTYQQVAQEMGLDRSSRAVGRACASNPTALVVPCHRVLRKDGGLGGYRWGLDRKEALLALEKADS